MSAYAGMAKIVCFNWPWYAGAFAATVLVVGLLGSGWISQAWVVPLTVAVAVGDAWLLVSLVVSFAIYDRSSIARGGWLDQSKADRVTIVHAGHDEASVHVARQLPNASTHVVDVCASSSGLSASLLRARAAASHLAIPADRACLPLPDASADLVVIVFAAHEIRDHSQRTELFRELGRIAGPGGRILVVEHLRDMWNFLAYGPGVFHFLSRRTWLNTFTAAHLRLEREDTMTPWVRRFQLRKDP